MILINTKWQELNTINGIEHRPDEPMTVLVRRLSSFALLCHVYTFWGTMLTWETAGTSVTGIYFCITGWLVYNYTIFAKLKIWSDASFCEEDIDIITCDRSIFMGNREMRFCPWFLGNLVCKFYLLQVTCVGMTPVKLYKLTLHQKSQQKQYAREYLITLSLLLFVMKHYFENGSLFVT